MKPTLNPSPQPLTKPTQFWFCVRLFWFVSKMSPLDSALLFERSCRQSNTYTLVTSLEREMDKSLEQEIRDEDREREGTVWTATTHIVTAVIGSGVLALAWSVAQLGWVVGPIVLFAFTFTGYTSTLLADCYRVPHPVTGSRNLTYISAVRSYLGPKRVFMCGVVQYAVLWGAAVGYTVTAATSIMAVKRSNCFHKNGHLVGYRASGTLLMIAFGIIEIILSQLSSLEKVTWLLVVTAAMSFAYSSIGLCLLPKIS